MVVDEVVKAFGGAAKMRGILGVSAQRFSNWERRGGFPGQFHGRIVEEARKRRIKLRLEDLQITRRDEAA